MRAHFASGMLASILLVALAWPSTASTLEDATSHFLSYQFDGDTHHDAPDGCSSASEEWSTTIGSVTDGMLVAPDDVSDVFVLDVPPGQRGQRLRVGLSEVADAADLETLELKVLVPGCTGTVLDAVNWPTPEPSPPRPAAGEAQHSSNTAPWRCDSRQWLFVIDQLQGYAEPATIHVAWTDGSEQPVPLYGRYGSLAVYSTGENLDVLLKGAWANLASQWAGTFGLAVGPCDAVDGGAVYGDAPLIGLGSIAFTAVHVGPHLVQVTYVGAAGDALMPVAAPVAVDPADVLPVAAGDVVHDHDAGSAGSGGTQSLPAVPSVTGALSGLQDPSTPSTVLAGAQASLASATDDFTVGLPGPVMVPASCHGCVDGLEGVWKAVSYHLTSMES